MVSAAVTLRPGTAPDRARTVAVEQLLVAAGQIGAGAGNLLFAIVMARLLAPAAFAHLTAFLGLFVLAGLPSTSLSAVGALAPGGSGRLDALLGRAGLAVAAALVGFSPWLARDLGLPVGVVIALAMAAPVVAPLGLQRGRLFGVGRHADLLASLLAEPVGRLTIGVLLGLGFGATGAAFGVAVAAVLALRVSYGPMAPSLPGVEGVATAGLGGTVAAFLLLAVVQTQDLLFANRLLGGAEAGRFAVLSTLGGIAAFATLTVPLVLLPRAASGQPRALPIAVGIAAAIGGTAVVVGAVAHDLLTRSLFGARYGAVAPLLAPYLLAMALLGVSRVLVAHRCARGEASSAVVVVGLVAAGQAWLIVHFAHSAAAVAGSTLSATATATAVLGGMEVAERMRWRARLAERVATAGNSVVVGLAGITAVGLAVRLVVPRGLWLDEATSVFQAKMGFSEMLTNLRTTDVHPPLYFTVLWGAVRVFGSSEMAVRLPSIVAGLALLPVLYLCGEELYDRRTGLVAAAIGSVSPLLVWYSQEARMYALFMVFAVAAVWLQARAIRRGRTLDWMLYAVVTAALVWTQYFAVLQVLVQQAAFLVVIARRQARRTLDRRVIYGWLGSAALAGLALAPLVPFAHHQFSVNQHAGRGFLAASQAGAAVSGLAHRPSVYTLAANLVWAAWGYHSDAVMAAAVALWPGLMFLGLLALGRRRRPPTTLLVAACLVPVLALFAIGMVKRDLFDVRYFSGTAALGVVLLARLMTGTARHRIGLALLSVIIVTGLVVGLVDQQTNGSNPRRYSFREATHALNRAGRDGDTVLYAPADVGPVVGYYDRGRYRLRPLSDHVARDSSRGRLFVLVSPRLLDPGEAKRIGDVLAQLRQRRRVTRVLRFDNVQVWELT